MFRLVTDSPLETEQVGAAIARSLRVGDVVSVRGELGAGKTVLIRGACDALGVQDRVTSPTFAIGHRYLGDVAVAHLDLYRFESMSAAEWADIEPLLDDAVAFVEWPEVGREFLPAPRAVVTLEHVAEQRRAIEVVEADVELRHALAALAPPAADS